MTIPKNAIDKIDFKGYHITRYADMVERCKSGTIAQLAPDTKVIILTHSAQVIGTVLDSITEETDTSETESQIFIKTYLHTLTKSLIRELSGEESGKPVESAAFSNIFKVINLKDVEVTSFSNPDNVFQYSHMTLYTDQIVGISFA